jgi:FKBP-type peptidyl-prolyl cis-trans isomerase 2
MLLRLLLTVLAAAALTVACGGDDDDDPEEPADEEATEAEGDGTPDGGEGSGEDPCPGEDQAGEGDPVAEGDSIVVDYCGYTTADGEKFDEGSLDVVIGETSLIEGFTNALIGMQLGERKTVDIPAAEAYGEQNPDLVTQVPEEELPGAEVGAQVSCGGSPGEVTEIADDGTVTVDCNHPLAGEDLTFEIELTEIAT